MLDIKRLSGCFEVRRLEESDCDAVLGLQKGNALFYRYSGGEAPSRERLIRDLNLTPPGVAKADKYYVGFFDAEGLAAVMDLVDGYPEKNIAYIGFFMMDSRLQGRHIGSALIGEVCGRLRAEGKTAVRLAIDRDNPQATHFWSKNGFRVLKEVEMGGWTALVAQRELTEPEEKRNGSERLS